MPYLIAQGNTPTERWRRSIPSGEWVTVGRSAGRWSAEWDDRISRRHARLRWNGERLRVERLAEAKNPIFHQGRSQDRFWLNPGDHFVIGATTFSLDNQPVRLSLDEASPATEQIFSPGYLRSVPFRDAQRGIDVLSRLPEIISGAATDSEMHVRLVNVLLSGVERATAAAVVAVPSGVPHEPSPPASKLQPAGDVDAIRVLHWDHRDEFGRQFAPSVRLIRRAVEKGESVVHLWRSARDGHEPQFTQNEDADWAFCTPIKFDDGRQMALYVAGRCSVPATPGGPSLPPSQDHAGNSLALPSGSVDAAARLADVAGLRDGVKFAELTANMFVALRRMKLLERKDAALRPFFSPVVFDALADNEPDPFLAPREVDTAVLFCDLRGFSRRSEQSSGDLLGLLHRVGLALGVMTRHILEEGGVVGDFHGDAAMGFWGWPLEHTDMAARACRAALAIQREFTAAAADGQNPLAGFRAGIGIAAGRAVAGRIGTDDQVKVTVFGPVVNLASRLEEMTKIVRAPILLDETVAALAREQLAPYEGRFRRVARVRPRGIETPLEVTQLLPASDATAPPLSDDAIAAYESALDALAARDWSAAFARLHQVPADDRVKDLLTIFIAKHNRTPPPDWNGVLPIDPST